MARRRYALQQEERGLIAPPGTERMAELSMTGPHPLPGHAHEAKKRGGLNVVPLCWW